MPGPTPQSKEELEQAAHDYGIAPGGRAMILAEIKAAEFSMNTGVYVVWRTLKGGEGSAGVRAEGQCCRLGPASRCFCNHTLAQHQQLNPKNPKAPGCAVEGCKCRCFNYVPMRPEECGMWHLPRRKGFNVHAWRAPCKCNHGHDQHDPVTLKCNACGNCRHFTPNYVCIGCDGRGDQHETVFELESERKSMGLPVGEAYMPLRDSPYLMEQVLEGAQRTEFKGAKKGSGGGKKAITASPESLLESGKIDIAEYRRLIALPPEPEEETALALPVYGELQKLGPGVGPTGREYAMQGATVKAMSIPVGGGQSMEIMTNLGKPMPQPGKDFSRPWEPQVIKQRPMAGAGGKKKEPLRPEIEDITPPSPRALPGRVEEAKSRSTPMASPTSTPTAGGGGGKVRAKERLSELMGLKESGLVTQAEYDQKRAEILKSL